MKPNAFEHLSDGTTVLFLKRRDGSTLRCIIDTADFDEVKKYKWHADRDGRTFYVKGRLHGKATSPNIQMHNLLCGLGADHKDHNGLNNRRSNLRESNDEERNRNRRKAKSQLRGITSIYKGVSWNKRVGKYVAQIKVNGKNHHLGYFANSPEAAHAYDTAARKYYGEFAAVNFPRLDEQSAHI